MVWNFQVYQNYYPLGFLYDSSYWIGLVGWKVETWDNQLANLVDYLNSNSFWFSELIKSIKNNTISYRPDPTWISDIVIRTLVNLTKWTFFKVTWIVSISNANLKNSNLIDKLLESSKVIWQETQDRVVTKSGIGNIANMLNIVRQSSSLLCRNKWIDFSNLPTWVYEESRSWLNPGYRIDPSNENRILCFDTNNWYKNFYVTQNLLSNENSTIIIIKGESENRVYFETSQFGKWNLDIFLEPWIVLLSNDSSNTVNIGSKWIIDPNESRQYSWTYLKGHYYVNWLLAGFDNSFNNYPMTGFNHKLVIEGWLASLNTIDTPSPQRQSQVFGILWKNSAPDSEKQNILERIPIIWIDWLNLWGAISRKCIKGKYWTDWTNCEPISEDENFWQLSWYIKDQTNIFAPLIWN